MSSTNKLLVACVSGVSAHLGFFIRGEWHMHAPAILLLHLILFGCMMARDWTKSGLLFPHIDIGLVYVLGIFSSMMVYRLSPSHRLHNFRGPRMAAVSKFWHVWQCRNSKNHELMNRLYQQYGDFVRIGPSEIASFHPDTIETTEGFGTKCIKSDFYDIMLPDFSLVFTRNMPMHHARRGVWSRALSTKAMVSYQDRIQRQIQVLMNVLTDHAVAKEAVEINTVMYWFAFDAMGEFAFNKDFGMMRNQKGHHIVTLFQSALSIIGPFAPTDPEERDISSFFIEDSGKDQDPSMALRWLKGDTATVIVAGSDTTAPTLTFLSYLLAKHPEDAEKVYHELTDVDPFDIGTISTLPHLNGVINEAMRLFAVATTTISRTTPSEGITIGDTWIPGHTKILTPRFVIFRSEDSFERAKDFVPERWYSAPHMVKNPQAFAPFGVGKIDQPSPLRYVHLFLLLEIVTDRMMSVFLIGRASCVGQGLAMTQVRMILASLVKQFHIRFSPGYDGVQIITEMKDQLTAKPGRLNLHFELRAT